MPIRVPLCDGKAIFDLFEVKYFVRRDHNQCIDSVMRDCRISEAARRAREILVVTQFDNKSTSFSVGSASVLTFWKIPELGLSYRSHRMLNFFAHKGNHPTEEMIGPCGGVFEFQDIPPVLRR